MSNASDNKPWDSLRQNLMDYPDKPTPMSKIDLIIDALLVAPPSVWSARMNEALFVARELKAELEPQVCCGDYEKCIKSCTPRGRWLANQQMNRLKQEKGQFVGGVPSVSQEREWAGLTDAELMKEFGYTDELLRDTAYRVDQLLEWKNT